MPRGKRHFLPGHIDFKQRISMASIFSYGRSARKPPSDSAQTFKLSQQIRNLQGARSLSAEKLFDPKTFMIKRNIMRFESLGKYLLNKKGVCEDFPFDPVVIVLNVMEKMFALIPLDKKSLPINLNFDPELALHFRRK